MPPRRGMRTKVRRLLLLSGLMLTSVLEECVKLPPSSHESTAKPPSLPNLGASCLCIVASASRSICKAPLKTRRRRQSAFLPSFTCFAPLIPVISRPTVAVEKEKGKSSLEEKTEEAALAPARPPRMTFGRFPRTRTSISLRAHGAGRPADRLTYIH